MKISIIGGGFVGFTCYRVFSQLEGYNICLYDKFKENCKAFKEGVDVNFVTLEEAAVADVIFVCLNTPMIEETGQCYTGIIERSIADLRNLNKESYIVIKSTVEPGTTERLNFSYGRIWFSPEFLTEARPYEDFVELPYQIIGVPVKDTLEFSKDVGKPVFEAFEAAYSQGIIKGKELHLCNSRVAEMVKYTRNCYLATRLSFFNEMKLICEKLKIDYDIMKDLAGLDPRVGQHYNNVNEENPGFGGSCLVKDLNALKYQADRLNVIPYVLDGVWAQNLEVRKFRDWEEMKGRAVIKKEDD